MENVIWQNSYFPITIGTREPWMVCLSKTEDSSFHSPTHKQWLNFVLLFSDAFQMFMDICE